MSARAILSVHILRKDLKLLWVLALLIAVLQALLAYVAFRAAPFDAGSGAQAVAGVVMFALTLALGLSVMSVVHQDALLGDSADWLVRPVHRGDLLFAKLLFMVLVIHVPIFVVNLCKCLAYGFPLLDSLVANLLSNLSIAVIFTLPITALAAITRNLSQALIGALFAFVVIVIAQTTGAVSTRGTGVVWVLEDSSRVLLLLSMAGVLWLQYFRRDTRRARALFACGLVLTMLITKLPWEAAVGVQRWFTPPFAPLALSFAPERRSEAVAGLTLRESDAAPESKRPPRGIVVPLKIEGLPAGLLLHTDHLRVRLTAPDGHVALDRRFPGFDVSVDQSPMVVLQSLRLTQKELARVPVQPLRAELEFAFTTLEVSVEGSVPVDGSARLDDIGHCAVRGGEKPSSVEIGCRALIEVPDCLGFRLVENAAPGPEVFECKPDYEPRLLRFSAEPLDRVNRSVPSLGSGNSVLVRRYEPQRHWTGHLVIPSVAVSDLERGPSLPP